MDWCGMGMAGTRVGSEKLGPRGRWRGAVSLSLGRDTALPYRGSGGAAAPGGQLGRIDLSLYNREDVGAEWWGRGYGMRVLPFLLT
jgi:hypothetical protein